MSNLQSPECGRSEYLLWLVGIGVVFEHDKGLFEGETRSLDGTRGANTLFS